MVFDLMLSGLKCHHVINKVSLFSCSYYLAGIFVSKNKTTMFVSPHVHYRIIES